MEINYFGLSNTGIVREENQDCFGKFPSDSDDLKNPLGILYVIADGMGGHAKGKVASNLAVEEIQHVYFNNFCETIEENLRLAFQSANSKIYNHSSGTQVIQKMGTTASAIVLSKEYGTIAHVGDSRIYLVHKEKIKQLTSDHTVVSELKKKGIINKEEAKHHPDRSVLNRAIGIDENVTIDIIKSILIQSGDIIILCTDGLAKVTPNEIKNTVLNNNAEKSCEILIDLANERGGRDNITVQIIKINSDKELNSKKGYTTNQLMQKKWARVFILSFVVFLIAAVSIFYFYEDLTELNPSNNEINELTDSSEQKKNVFNISKSESSLETRLAKADFFFDKSLLDSSKKIYRSILKDHPMNLESLNRLFEISQRFLFYASEAKQNSNFNEALLYYKKAAQLQPQNHYIINQIDSCIMAISLHDSRIIDITDADTDTLNKAEVVINSSKKKEEVVEVAPDMEINRTENYFWNLEELLDSDFNINGKDIKFLSNARPKKVLNTYILKDVVITVKAEFENLNIDDNAGLIIGYSWNEITSIEKYFLFTFGPNKNFFLYEVTDGNKTKILEVSRLNENVNPQNVFLLRAKSFGPWIMIYQNDKLLKAYSHGSFIVGRVGLCADKFTEVSFTKFDIKPAINNLK